MRRNMKDIQLAQSIIKCYHPRGYQVPKEIHSCFELVYYRYGQGSTIIKNQCFPIVANSFVLIPPETEHSEIHEADCELFFMRFYSSKDFITGYFTDHSQEIYSLLNTINHEIFERQYAYKERIELKLHELFILMQRYKINDNPHETKCFDYAINYIFDNYNEKISFQTLAERSHFSYNYFQHQFKKQTGYSPQQYLIKRRIDVAKKFLTDTSLNCTEISYQCGFANSAQFSSIFKRDTGMTPLQYRENLKNHKKETLF